MGIDVVTFGCRLNIVESEAMRRHAEAAGLGSAGLGSAEWDDIVIVNTCAVTGEATRQARQTIRRLARERPGARIVVTGCAAQVEPEAFAAMPEVARVLGNAEKMRAGTWKTLGEDPGADLDASGDGVSPTAKIRVDDIMTVREAAPPLVDGLRGHTRAFVQVQNGCDHRCTFCIIPFGRGPSRSVPMGAVVEQVRTLVGHGSREVVLTGVDITAYGSDLPGLPKLGTLVKGILRHVPELERLRLSSIDSVEADPDLLDAFAGEARLMPHLHLSLQAGDDMILTRMKRRHRRADAVAFCERLRHLRPDIVFGADIIAGFPTEDEAMFARSLDIVDACGLTHLHVFPFSPRPGTPAARMPQVGREVVKERAALLREAGAEALARHLAAERGATRRVLVERGGVGHTEHFTPTEIGFGRPGEVVAARVTGHTARALLAVAA
ncbi:MAG: tRNA (N(6)-L-threonylcarbamoyladenosine(37)-C(2))-methylthiotransferase MtaB [Microvirga sp.]